MALGRSDEKAVVAIFLGGIDKEKSHVEEEVERVWPGLVLPVPKTASTVLVKKVPKEN